MWLQMVRDRKYGRLNLGFTISEEYEEFEEFQSTIPSRKKAQAILELYMFCKKKTGIEEVRSNLLYRSSIEEYNRKNKQYEENFDKYNQKYLKKGKKKKTAAKKIEISEANETEIEENVSKDKIEYINERIELEEKEDLPEDQGNIDVADTSPEAMEEDDYIPDIEALKDFF